MSADLFDARPLSGTRRARLVRAAALRRTTRARPAVRALSLALKRAFDIAASVAGLAVFAIPFVIIWLLVVATSAGPGLFWSTRVGRDGRPFRMPKFRTMRCGISLRPREELVLRAYDYTPIGLLLRRTSLDELPQLWSVLAGDMSIIGPRPLLAGDPAADQRLNFPAALSVRPGISGLAQVNGRNGLTPRRKARLDALYARSVCVRVDAMLLAKTVVVIVNGRGFL